MPNVMRQSCLLLLLLTMGVAHADDTQNSFVTWFEEGQRLYAADEFVRAAAMFKQATQAAPDNDEYVYWLGKAYGRQAEKAGWLNAIKYAKLTRQSFERAVALNPENWPAVRDLAAFYAEAPGFLGGDQAKARSLRASLPAVEAAVEPAL